MIFWGFALLYGMKIFMKAKSYEKSPNIFVTVIVNKKANSWFQNKHKKNQLIA